MKHAPAFLALVESVMPRIKEISADEVMALKPSPLEGEGRVGGALSQNTPPPNPLPQGEGEYVLIDVREESEFAAGYAKGAIHLGRGIIERDIENTVPDKHTKIILYCGGGYRSALAADSLQKMGYSNVYSMAGGWRSWCEKGLPRK